MSEILGNLIEWAEGIMLSLGYIGIVLVIILETIIPPIPSEVFLPLAGSLSARPGPNGESFNFFLVVLAATLGSFIGASMLYGISRWAGEHRVGIWLDRYGKWLMMTSADLQRSRVWFAHHGNLAVLIARVIPGMRSIIAVPAGLASMPFGNYALFTILGSLVWNLALVTAGYVLGANWHLVEVWLDPISPFIYAAIVLSVLAFIAKRLYDRRKLGESKRTG